MCFRKKQVVIDSKYKVGDFVDFHHYDDTWFGWIDKVYLDESSNVIYDINVGGQCPVTCKRIEEEKIVRIRD